MAKRKLIRTTITVSMEKAAWLRSNLAKLYHHNLALIDRLENNANELSMEEKLQLKSLPKICIVQKEIIDELDIDTQLSEADGREDRRVSATRSGFRLMEATLKQVIHGTTEVINIYEGRPANHKSFTHTEGKTKEFYINKTKAVTEFLQSLLEDVRSAL